MKKLMIAAAAAAMVGGASAGEQCVACGYAADPAQGTNPAFYNVQFKLNTLAPKKVKCGGCDGFAMESAKRTIDGILWTCEICDTDHPYQLALWEKSGSIQYTADLVYRTIGALSNYSWAGVYTVTGVKASGYTYNSAVEAYNAGMAALGAPIVTGQADVWTSKQQYKKQTTGGADTIPLQTQFVSAPGSYATQAAAEAALITAPTAEAGYQWVVVAGSRTTTNEGKYRWAKQFTAQSYNYTDNVKKATEAEAIAYAQSATVLAKVRNEFLPGAIVDFKSATATKVASETLECAWFTENALVADGGYLDLFRYSKKADKLEALLKNTFTAPGGETFEVYAAGFGTYDLNKKCPKSISGSAVGAIDPTPVACTGDMGSYLDVCEDFDCGVDCWADINYDGVHDATAANTFFTGTWTVKQNQSLTKKVMNKNVPSFYTVTVNADCAE